MLLEIRYKLTKYQLKITSNSDSDNINNDRSINDNIGSISSNSNIIYYQRIVNYSSIYYQFDNKKQYYSYLVINKLIENLFHIFFCYINHLLIII